MTTHFLVSEEIQAAKWTGQITAVNKANDFLRNNKNIYDISRRFIEGYYMKFLNSVNPVNPVMAVNIRFEGEPKFD